MRGEEAPGAAASSERQGKPTAPKPLAASSSADPPRRDVRRLTGDPIEIGRHRRRSRRCGLRVEILRHREPVMSPCNLFKLIPAMVFYLIAMPSPAAAELAAVGLRNPDVAGACAIGGSVNDAAGKPASSGKDK